MKVGIIFDLDGTLLDTLGDLCDSVNYALIVHGHPVRTLEEVRRFVGNGIGKLIERSAPEGADTDAVLRTFREYYHAHDQVKTRPYAGISAALEEVREKYPVAVVSNKVDTAVKPLCRNFFPGVYALGETEGCPRKPAPDMVYRAMADIGVEKCLYVGDSEVDVTTAANAGVDCLCVTWGFRDKQQLIAAGGKYFCDDPKELLQMIETILK